MPQPAAQVCADDQPVSLHFTKVLCEHFLGRHREHPAQLAQSRGSSPEAGENSDFPLPLNQRDCELNGTGLLRLGADEDPLLLSVVVSLHIHVEWIWARLACPR